MGFARISNVVQFKKIFTPDATSSLPKKNYHNLCFPSHSIVSSCILIVMVIFHVGVADELTPLPRCEEGR